MKTKPFLVAAAILVATGASARVQNINVWRGETATERINDDIEIGALPKGVGVRFGVLRSVKYAPTPRSLKRDEILDRVEWTDDPKGERIIEISVPADARPGIYKCGMIDIYVGKRVLPPVKEWKYYLDLWQHPWAVARINKVEPFSKAHYDAMRPLWQQLAAAGQKTLTVTLVDQPWNHQCRDAYHSMVGHTRRADGTWSFDYKVFDEYVAFGKSCGLGPDISCYTMCPWGYICRYFDEKSGKVVESRCIPGKPEFEDFWGEFLIDFSKHLKEKGWFEQTLVAMDEREPKDVKIVADFIQQRAPGMRISMAGNRKPSDFKGIKIDSYAQVLSWDHVTPEFLAEAAERRAQGLITTQYVCCWPEHPNTMLMNRQGEAFWCGAYSALGGLDGFLRWAYNSWPEDPMADASFGYWNAGDTFLVYPDGAPSWRFLELKRGITAAEKLRLLKEEGVFGDEIGAIAKRFNIKEANEARADYRKLREDLLHLVNK